MIDYDEEQEMQEYYWDKPKPGKDKGDEDDDVEPVFIDNFIFLLMGIAISYVYFKLKNSK